MCRAVSGAIGCTRAQARPVTRPSTRPVTRPAPGSQLMVYRTEDMYLLDKKSIEMPGIQDFEW